MDEIDTILMVLKEKQKKIDCVKFLLNVDPLDHASDVVDGLTKRIAALLRLRLTPGQPQIPNNLKTENKI